MNPISGTIWLLIRAYQLVISPWLAPSCRFEPSCSHYALDAVSRHGAIVGTSLAVWRILRCNPWGGQGHDPVPEAPLLRRSGRPRSGTPEPNGR